MSLLERIARSDGDPQRTIAALRLIHERQVRELRQCQGYSPAKTEVGQRVTTTFLHADETLEADLTLGEHPRKPSTPYQQR